MYKKFGKKVFIFLLTVIVFIVALVCTPLTPLEKSSYLHGICLKDSLLFNTNSPRIIFVGGSNLPFGLNCQLIKDSLAYNPIDLGLHAGIGLNYMLKSSLDGIKKNDVVVVIPEYEFLCGETNYGGETLLRVIACQGFKNLIKLSWNEQQAVLSCMPKYAISKTSYLASKLPFFSSLLKKNAGDSLKYNSHVFNKYGDVNFRWPGGFKHVDPSFLDDQRINNTGFDQLLAYKKQLEEKGAKLYIGFPAFQKTSYDGSKRTIDRIRQKLQDEQFKLLGSPEKYVANDSLLYDTPYHLSLEGCDWRTKLLINDLRISQKKE